MIKNNSGQQPYLIDVLQKHAVDAYQFVETIRATTTETLPFRRLGDIGFYVIIEGHFALEMIGDQQPHIIRICGPTDVIGFGIWLAPELIDQYQLRALDKAKVIFMPHQKFLDARIIAPELNDYVIHSLCKIIALKDKTISALENHSVEARVMALLDCLVKKFGAPDKSGTMIDVSIDRLTLAALARTSVESFSRALTKLQDTGIILRKRRKIVVKNVNKLTKRISKLQDLKFDC